MLALHPDHKNHMTGILISVNAAYGAKKVYKVIKSHESIEE
jgi:hypothetical protein